MMSAFLSSASHYMRPLTTVAGVSTVLWVAFAPVIALASSGVARAWGWVGTVLTAVAVLATLLAAAFSPNRTGTRLRWIAYSFFMAPFGPACFWTWGVDREPERNWRSRGSLWLLAGTAAAILVLAALARVDPTNMELWLRSGAGIVCVLGLWQATLITRGRSYLLPLGAIVLAVGLLTVVNTMGIR